MKKAFLLAVPLLILAGCFGGGEDESSEHAAPGGDSVNELKLRVKALEDERKELRKNLTDLKAKVPKSVAKPGAGDESLKMEAEAYIKVLEGSISKVDSQIEVWRGPMRKSFEGQVFKGFKLADGQILDSVKIDQVTDDFIKIQDGGGSRQLNWADIALETRVALVHEPSVVETAIK